jgi:hypothetical protein
MLFKTTSPLDLDNILAEVQKIDPSMTLFRGYGVVNLYSTKHKYSVSPIVNLEKSELIFELCVPNGFVGNEIFAGSPDQCIDWLRENFNDIVAMSNFAGRVGTREEYLVSIGENPAEAAEFDPLTDEATQEAVAT